MRLSPLLAAAVLLLAAGPVLPASDTEGAALRLSAEKLNFGLLSKGRTKRLTLALDNAGGAPLEITRVTVNCECTSLRLSTPTRLNVPIDRSGGGRTDLSLAPGASARLDVDLETRELGEGALEKECLIYTDGSASPLHVPITAEIKTPVRPVVPTAVPSERAGDPLPVEPTGPQPLLHTDELVHDFGTVLRGEMARHVFTLDNAGEGDLLVQDVRSTCTCTLTEVWIGDEEITGDELIRRRKDRLFGTVPPGGEFRVAVEMDTGKLRGVGPDHPVRKAVRIYSNDLTQNPLNVTLEARIADAFQIEPQDLRFPRMRKGETASMTLSVRSDQIEGYKLEGVEVTRPESLRATLRQTGDGPAPSYEIDVEVLPGARVGRLTDNLKLVIDHPRIHRLTVPVYADILSQVVFEGNGAEGYERLDFGVLDGTADASLTMKIENLDPSVPYVPSNVELLTRTGPEFLSYELKEIEKGVRYDLTVSVSKDIEARFFNGKIRIESDHPDVPLKLVDFRGWVDRSKAPGSGDR
jgi:hypothetical protein